MSASHRGKLLVASPTLVEPSFRRTVLLLLEHTDDGALGLVLNRASQMPVADPLPAWSHLMVAPAVVFHGGPVEVSGVLCLVQGAAVGGAAYRRFFDDVGTLDLHQSPDDVVGVEAMRAFAGHAGWGPGQLDDELERRSWLVLDREPGDVFTDRPDDLWANVLARQPGIVALLSAYPEDVNLN